MVHPRAPISSAFTSHALRLLQRVQRGISSVELVYTTHERWPFLPDQPIHARSALRISVLDSSFNPPTLAHLALANSPRPECFSTSSEPYDARLLLLSVRNADKALNAGDATFLQRLEMMRLLSDDMRSSDLGKSGGGSSQTGHNVAIAIINEPMFVRKSALLIRFLQTRLDIADDRDTSHRFPSPEVTFLMGSDTLVRFFSPKYYPSATAMVQMLRKFLSPDEEGSRIVCAHRGAGNVVDQDKTLEIARQFIANDRIAFIDIGKEEQAYSSTQVRAKVAGKEGSWKWLVTDAIADYIVTQDVYSGQEREQ